MQFRIAHATTDFMLASAEALPFEDGKFNFYIARGSLMYMDIRKALREARRVLEDGGRGVDRLP